jgi:hypothetical protein
MQNLEHRDLRTGEFEFVISGPPSKGRAGRNRFKLEDQYDRSSTKRHGGKYIAR